MASNDPIASKARKPALSVEDAERFASQIRPSWELLGPDGAAGGFGLDDAPGVAPAPSAGAPGRAHDTIIEGVPTVVVAGSDEAVPVDADWDIDEPATTASEPAAPPIEAQVIASIGIPSKVEVPVGELPLPPQVGHPMVPTPGAPIAPAPAARTRVGMGGTSGEREPMAKPEPTRAPASAPAPVSARAASAPASGKATVSKSRPGAANPAAAYVPAADEADDDIALPISGAPKGLLLKIGGGVTAVAVILIAIKVFSGSSAPDPAKTAPPPAATTAAAVDAPPPLDPTLAEPPKTAAATTATVAPTVTATTAPTTAPIAKETPVVAKVEPPPVATAKKPPAAPPATTAKPPAGPVKKGGGIIRETPF